MDQVSKMRSGKIRIARQLGKGKSGYSFLAYRQDRPVVLKLMHDEPCSYYTFGDNKIRLELNAYEHLKRTGIAIPRLLHYNLDENYLIKEFINGPTAADWLISGGRNEAVMAQLFDMAARVRQYNLNIDFFPTNFVLSRKRKLYYVDYEINPFDEKWSLSSWGLYYWANPEGLAAYFRNGDPTAINLDPDSGMPIKAPFEAQVQSWIDRFGVQEPQTA